MKKFFLKKVNNMKLRNKLIFSFLVVVFIPVLIVGLFLTSELRKMALDSTLEQTVSDMTRIKARISDALVPPTYVSNALLVDQRLKDIVNTNYDTVYDVVEAYRNFTYFENNIRYYNEIENIRFYVNNDSMLNNWRFIPVKEEILNNEWYQEAIANSGLMSWGIVEDEIRGIKNNFSITRMIHFAEFNTYGVLAVDMNTNYLNFILSQESLPILFLDANNNIVATNASELIGNNLEDITISPKLINGDLGTFQDVVFNDPSHIMVDAIRVPNSVNDLRIVSIIPDAHIMEGANKLQRLGFVVISVSIIIALFLIYGVSHLISKRISILSKQIQTVAMGNLSTYAQVEGEDEIGKLSTEFNRMTISIKELLEEVEQKNREKNVLEKRQNEMKLKMLASQINPHFLFNTLETIRMKTLLKGEKEIAHVVKRLGKLLRISLEVGGKMVPLKQEIDMVTAYLEIQNFRFDERLEYELNIDSESLNIEIPPLIIQPLVENAVIHGLERKLEGGKIVVETKIRGGDLLVQVIDNGIGISENKKEEIFFALTEDNMEEENRIGLKNVHERILLTYNTGKGLVIFSEEEKGTRISFTIPLKRA
ncbi:histidine kinase [Alkalihalobacillus alcalophilus ATCC 27647 = CGMCC 1.3604]|uniref:histidine kinase n=1 Tax=Alkalihalobacillus alcalophilus ATCC 27647 = CGMCC 1.3604 TaxID=1218173 RepID=A0A094WQ65_ALKAL|nr:sensor histidine kinase [Alkalihalobacillus alcalophilus]KGA98961.1 histidine kinase [Alkalihalobacillus alcalophilus ATCC 27647 = CGMCC 1.3604]MED1561998.1 sensor histidine kinase [Alkalihalobacillus alcalophilus]THG89146.1 histidine kinase [Alkalihalobacillus alcalophilus ATCC 27647 = CGMCC 1.3604]